MEQMTHWFAAQRARSMSRGMRPGRVLEIGCGRGTMLHEFAQRGWSVQGVEFSEQAAFRARQGFGIDVHTGSLSALDAEAGSFDLVVFWHSLEHFRAPDDALRETRRLLRRGGRLVVAVPNSESLQSKVFGRHWFHLDVPRHHHHFGESSLRKLLDRSGFTVQKVDHLNLEQNPYGVLQSVMNRLGFPENFLYSMLKSRSARTHDVTNHPGLVAATIALLPAASVFAIVLAAAEAAIGRGGTIAVTAAHCIR
jgi:2-polyprenyl-3-methyl-5-hydroxy-6-metoxy-1,4-benzoquinol methylase